MRIESAVTEHMYAHDYTKHSRIWYGVRLYSFAAWCEQQGVNDIEQMTPSIIRRFLEHVRDRTNPRTGEPVGGHTVHAYARAVRALLNWTVREVILGDERLPRRIVMPKVEQKLLNILTPDHIGRLFRACTQDGIFAVRDKAILALLLDTGMREASLYTRQVPPHLVGMSHPMTCAAAALPANGR